MARLRAKPGLRQDFLTHVIASAQFSEYVRNIMGGTNVPHISGGQIKAFKFWRPSESEQAAIAEKLSAYDDLIENNRRRITLLEEAARLLYREWFVYFRFPGHEHIKMSNGTPDGWQSVPVQEVCTTYDDGDWLETKDQGGEDYRILQISNIGMNCFTETGNYRFITEETFRRLKCHEVVAGDILISRMPKPIGRGWLVTEMPFRMVTAVDVTIVRADEDQVDPYYLLYHINSEHNIRRCEGVATGATRPRISRKNMGSLPIILPPIRIQRQFGEIVAENNRAKANLEQQNRKLAQARDFLLPRLMNGEIAV